jgi:hypothetical protein
MNSHEFDIWLKNRLEGLEIPYDDASWKEFEKQLTEAELTQFDQEIRDKLDTFSAPSVAGAWAAFENKLDIAEKLLDDSLDDVVRGKLKEASAPNDPNAWYKFLPVLQSFETYRRRLIITKVSEFLLIFAVLFTIFNLHQHGVFTAPLKKEKKEQINKAKSNIPIAKAESTSQDEGSKLAITENESTVNADSYTYATNSQNIDISNDWLSNSTNEAAVSLLSTPQVTQTNIELVVAFENSQIDDESISELVNELQSVPELDYARNSLVYASLPLKYQEIEFDDLPFSKRLSSDLGLPILKKVKKIELLAGVGISGNLDQINTPFDEYYNIEPYQQIKGSSGADITFRAKGKRIGLRTVLGFSRKNYDPQPVYELIGGDVRSNYNAVSLKSIEFDILSSTLHSTYDIVSRSRFSIYAMAGASLNLLAYSTYDRKEYEVPIKGEPKPTEREGGEGNNTVIADAKSYVKGILQGGTFKNNRFMTVDAGLGIEWKVTPRSRLFINPVYKHMLTTEGIGPNQDHVNSLSFRAGIETLL